MVLNGRVAFTLTVAPLPDVGAVRVDLGRAVAEMAGHRPRVGLEMTGPVANDAELARQTHTAKRRISTELAKAAIAVEVTYSKGLICIALQEDNTVRANPSASGAQSANGLGIF